MSEFKREVRYTVIKHNQLTESQMQYLKNCIFGEGIPTVEAVVVESDWPEYQPVWKMIEDRVSGAPVEGGKAEYDALAQSMTTNQTIDGVPLLPCPFCGGEPYGTHDHYVHDDLSPMPCVECRACSAHLKAEDWNRRAEPAAQPQGEPVAWGAPKTVRQLIRQLETLDQDLRPLSMLRVPASVFEDGKERVRATHLSFSHERVDGQWLAPFKSGGEKVVAFWCRMEQPAPVAVVLPDQKTVSALVTKAARQADLTNGANYYTAAELAAEAVIDEVTRLNHSL